MSYDGNTCRSSAEAAGHTLYTSLTIQGKQRPQSVHNAAMWCMLCKSRYMLVLCQVASKTSKLLLRKMRTSLLAHCAVMTHDQYVAPRGAGGSHNNDSDACHVMSCHVVQHSVLHHVCGCAGAVPPQAWHRFAYTSTPLPLLTCRSCRTQSSKPSLRVAAALKEVLPY